MTNLPIVATSPESLESQQTAAAELAQKMGQPVTCSQRLNFKPNKPCPLCKSGKKWKKCCGGDKAGMQTVVTFYPKDWFNRQKLSKSMTAAMASVLGIYAAPALRDR